MNLVQLAMDNYQRQQILLQEQGTTPDGRNSDNRSSVNSALLMGQNTMKIQYLTTDFVRKLRIHNPEMSMMSEADSESFQVAELYQNDQALQQYFNHDLVLLPFFFDSTTSSQWMNRAMATTAAATFVGPGCSAASSATFS